MSVSEEKSYSTITIIIIIIVVIVVIYIVIPLIVMLAFGSSGVGSVISGVTSMEPKKDVDIGIPPSNINIGRNQ